MMLKRIFKHFHFCCGLGGGAKGFNNAKPVVGNMQAEWQCIGGIDVDPAGLRDFQRLSGVPGTLLDLFTLGMYTTLLLAEAGETFMLNSMPIWVQPVAVALSVSQQVTP